LQGEKEGEVSFQWTGTFNRLRFVASQDGMAAQKAAGHLARGLLSGDEVVTHEVFSYSGDIYLDRQVLTIF
jgi:hypothetical protein